MSVLQMSLVFKHSHSKGVARLVLLAMADEASEDGELSAYRRSQSWLQKKANCGRTAVIEAIKTLVELGELEVVRQGDGRESSDYRLRVEGSEIRTPARTNPDPRGPESGPPSSQSSPVSPVVSSSLRSEELNAREGSKPQKVLIAQHYWDWHLAESGGAPAQDFKALMAVVQACLKREYQPDEIIDAMKFTCSGMTAAKVIDRIGYMRRAAENRPSTAAIPTAILQDVNAARPWFSERWDDWLDLNRIKVFDALATLQRWGYGVGESMVRLAVAMHNPDQALDPGRLANMNVDRFPGRIASDYIISTMEAAYKNKSWRAS